MKDQKVIYEPHPVTPERKAELRAQGYRIIDAKFKPQDLEETEKDGVEKQEAFDRKAAFALLKENGLSVAKNTPSEKLAELVAELSGE